MKRNHNGLLLLIFLLLIAAGFVGSNIQVNTDPETINVGDNTYDGIKVTLFGIEIPKLGRETGEVDTDVIGEYRIRYTPFWESKSYEKMVYVVDSQIPDIILNGNSEVTVGNITEYVEEGYVATDNYDGDITEKVVTNLVKCQNNYYEMEYSVQDSSHNQFITKREIHIKAGTVYLTFDDGPSCDITPRILDILKEKNVTATFFVLGYDKDGEELIRREYAEGHTIALHGYSHEYSIYTSVDTVMENFKKIQQLVEQSTGYTSKIIRFPGGSSNTVSKDYCIGVMSEAVERVKAEGYAYFDWNVDSSDAGGAKDAQEVYNNVISGIQPGRSNVVLMHDFSGNSKTLEALEGIIDYCIQNNYELKSINSGTEPVHHNVAN